MFFGPYEVAEGGISPAKRSRETGQAINIDGDGQVIVNEIPYDVEYFQVTIRVTRSLGEDIFSYITNGLRYAATPFVFVDDYGVSRWVRYWGKKKIEMTDVNIGLVQMKLLLRKEVP